VRGLQERRAVAPLRERRAREGPPRPGRRLGLVTGAAAVVVLIDQLSKEWALSALREGPINLVWTLRLRLTFNSGAAFGLARGLAPLLVVVGLILVVGLLGVGRSLAASAASSVALGLVLGGAVGNLSDRLLRQQGGAVIDFIDLQWWPVFNLADAAICIGAGLMVVCARTRAPDPEA
jgi:signal peptidase II